MALHHWLHWREKALDESRQFLPHVCRHRRDKPADLGEFEAHLSSLEFGGSFVCSGAAEHGFRFFSALASRDGLRFLSQSQAKRPPHKRLKISRGKLCKKRLYRFL